MLAVSSGLVALGAGCSQAPPASPVGPAARVEQAEMALILEDFVSARTDLLQLAAGCETSDERQRALLLLAAAELDPGNPRGSTDDAARLAASYLTLPEAPLGELALARAVYRLAIDRGGAVEWSDGESIELPAADEGDPLPRCIAEAAPWPVDLPVTPGLTTANRVATLREQVSVREDSLSALAYRIALQDSVIARLEAEITRITTLLTIAAPKDTSRVRR